MSTVVQEPTTVLGDAREMLARCGQTCQRVIRVEGDCILYVSGAGIARTLWLHVPEDGRTRYWRDDGFPAEPPPGWHEKRASDEYWHGF